MSEVLSTEYDIENFVYAIASKIYKGLLSSEMDNNFRLPCIMGET